MMVDPKRPPASPEPAKYTHLTIEQAVEILNRSERGRAVGRQLYEFLSDKAISLDMDGKVAVLALIEECFINRPGSVLGALDDAFVASGGAA